jgi:hypothetical protein
MTVGEEELRLSFPHQALATREAFRSEQDGSEVERAPNCHDPLGKAVKATKSESQFKSMSFSA